MVSIGLRVNPKGVTYAIVECPRAGFYTVRQTGPVAAPAAVDEPRQLHFIRSALLDIIEENGVVRAGLRLAEGNAQRIAHFRLNIEGVVREMMVGSAIARFFEGRIASIAAALGESDRRVMKEYFDGRQPRYIEADWGSLDSNAREAALVAAAAGAVS
jgi:hypothetical protein